MATDISPELRAEVALEGRSIVRHGLFREISYLISNCPYRRHHGLVLQCHRCPFDAQFEWDLRGPEFVEDLPGLVEGLSRPV